MLTATVQAYSNLFIGPRAVARASGDVDEQGAAQIGLFLELLDVIAILLGPDLPVDASQVVAVGIFAMLAELDRLPEIRAVVHAGEEALDDVPRTQLEPCDPLDRFRMQESLGIGRGIAGLIRLPGGGDRHDPRDQIVGVTPSLSAAKFNTSRCRSTGLANACTSSQATCVRPCNKARALAPRIKNCTARGPAPELVAPRRSRACPFRGRGVCRTKANA